MVSFPAEPARPLSESILWKLQRNYFDRYGVRAWSEGVVPQNVTSNPWIADAYAQIVFGWIRDGSREGLDPREPLYVLELGCGSGRFGWLFINRLRSLLSRSPLRGQRVTHVYTDFTEYNLDVLRSHPSLQPLVDAGAVDFARFDLETDHELELTHSGELLTAGRVVNPLAVIANYVFDGVRQDAFRVIGGVLHENLVRIEVPAAEVDVDDPELLKQVTLAYEPRRTAAAERYADPLWNRILEEYARGADDRTFLFPTAALTFLDTLRRLSSGRALLLSADKGYRDEESMTTGDPYMAVHGSFSLMVSYHAIERWATSEGGTFLSATRRSSTLPIVACLFGGSNADWSETRLAFDAAIERRGPDDFFAVKRAVEAGGFEHFTLQQLIAILRLSGWDSTLFLRSFPDLLAKVPDATTRESDDLRAAARNIHETYFPLREALDVAFHLGLLMEALGAPEDAILFFEESMRRYGPGADVLLHLAVCHIGCGAVAPARAYVAEALALEPENETVRRLSEDLERDSGPPPQS